ncbi:MAG: Rpn family recombination-promoting nuclease/putative transposase [Puniceicoccales bacterium]|nr:Rpn family recombination-promoting nuclease/putative transposase [Puniceicoccales bacterium]
MKSSHSRTGAGNDTASSSAATRTVPAAAASDDPHNPDDKIAKTTSSDAAEFCSLLRSALPPALRETLHLEPKRMRLLDGEFIAKNFSLLKTDLLWRVEYRPEIIAAGDAPECAFVVLHFD